MSNQAVQVQNDGAKPGEDKRLERLFDYTKWHIGIYLTMGGGLVGLLASSTSECVRDLILYPRVFGAAILAMALAGLAGGMITSAATRVRSFEHVWDRRLRLYGARTFKGSAWACIEHTSFWVSLLLLSCSVLWGRSFDRITSGTAPKACCECAHPKAPSGQAEPSNKAPVGTAPESVQRP